MNKTNKRFAVIFAVAVEALLITVLVFSVLSIIPKKWETRENSSISQVNSDGTMSTATLKYFARPKQDRALSNAKGVNNINDLYITMLNEDVSAAYIRENGFTQKIELKKLAASSNDFCYEISGAENGAVWEVWITFGDNGTPNMTIVKTGGTK